MQMQFVRRRDTIHSIIQTLESFLSRLFAAQKLFDRYERNPEMNGLCFKMYRSKWFSPLFSAINSSNAVYEAEPFSSVLWAGFSARIQFLSLLLPLSFEVSFNSNTKKSFYFMGIFWLSSTSSFCMEVRNEQALFSSV